MDHAALSDYARMNLGVESMRDLTAPQLRRLCKMLRAQGAKFKRKRRKRSPDGQRRRFREDNPDALPTPEQDRYLMKLFEDVETLLGSPTNRTGFIKRVLKNKNRVWPQNRAEAAKVIEGLKGWISQLKRRQLKG